MAKFNAKNKSLRLIKKVLSRYDQYSPSNEQPMPYGMLEKSLHKQENGFLFLPATNGYIGVHEVRSGVFVPLSVRTKVNPTWCGSYTTHTYRYDWRNISRCRLEALSNSY